MLADLPPCASMDVVANGMRRGDAMPETQSNNTQKAERLFSPLFIFIVVMTLCSFVVGQGLNAGTSVYLDHLGQGATLAGILAAVFSAAAAVTRLACGPLIDNVGRVIVMLGGTVFLFVGSVLPLFASGTVVFTLCRILQGIGFSAATTAAATAASDVLPLSRLGEGIGYYGLGQALAMSIGPALALFLANTDPPENLYLGLSAVAALAFAITLLCRYEKNPRRLPETCSYYQRTFAKGESSPSAGHAVEQDASDKLKASGKKESFASRFLEPRALPGMLPMLVLSPAFGFGIFFMGLYGTSLGYANAGLFYTVSAVAMVAVRLTSKAFMDKVAPFKIMLGAVICGVIGFSMALFAGENEALFYVAGIPYGLCLGIALPLNQSVAVKNTSASRWGAANALYLLASDIGIGAASAVWGVVNDAAGFTTSIFCALCCMALSLLVAWIAYPGHGMKPMTQRQ